MDIIIFVIIGLILAIVVVGALLAIQHFYHDLFFMGPFVPTEHERLQSLVIMADLADDDVVYDLGCGDGRVLIAASEHRRCRCIGYEISLVPYMLAKWRTRKYDQITIVRKNFMQADLRDANKIFLYLLDKPSYEKLGEKLQTELPNGALVIAQGFPFKKWSAIRENRLKDRGKVYLYKIVK